jgi:hypothetical protein
MRYLGNYPLSSGPCVNSAAGHDFPDVATSCANAPTALGQVKNEVNTYPMVGPTSTNIRSSLAGSKELDNDF